MQVSAATVFKALDRSGDLKLTGAEVVSGKGRRAGALDNVAADQFEGVLQSRHIPAALIDKTATAINLQEQTALYPPRPLADRVASFFMGAFFIVLNLALLPLSLLFFPFLAVAYGPEAGATISFLGFVGGGTTLASAFEPDLAASRRAAAQDAINTLLERPELA